MKTTSQSTMVSENEGFRALTESEMSNIQGGAGTSFLRFTFGTVFTTKIDWSGPADETND